MEKSFKEFTKEFPEFYRISPTILRASFVLEKKPDIEIYIDLEQEEIRSLAKIPHIYYFRLKKFAELHKMELKVIFEENMEKFAVNKLAELTLARESLRKKTLEKTASVEDKERLKMIEVEIEKEEQSQ